MKNRGSGSVTVVLVIIIVLLAVVSALYLYGTDKRDLGDLQSQDWKTYSAPEIGYQISYPRDWRLETLEDGSFRIVNPARSGKPNTGQPSESVYISPVVTMRPCQESEWQIGAGSIFYGVACFSGHPRLQAITSAFDEQGKKTEEKILSTLKFLPGF